MVITGGTGGLGHAVVRRLIAEYTCVVPYIAAREWASLQGAIGNERLHGIEADITDEATLQRMAQQIREQHGPLYGVAHLAGGFAGGSVEATTLDDWNKLIALNLTSTFLVIRTLLPLLQANGAGRIVTVSSAAALDRPAGLAAYNVSKIGVQTLTEVLANELRGTRITANTILPASMATPAMLKQMPADQLVPLERVADTIAFLLSDNAASINGASIPITETGGA